MAQDPSHLRPSSADSSLRPKSPSMLYSMLPSAVKSRLPSLRRSSSMYGLTTRPRIADPSYSSSGSRTPDATFAGAMLWSGPGVEKNLYFPEGGMEESEEAIAQMDKMRRRQTMILDENRSGIGWKFASQGFNLLSLAAGESSIISRDPKLGNASFARQLYIHGIIYLLRALPTDLTVEEQLSVRSALPQGVVPLRLEDSTYAPTSRTATQPSILHRTLASIIIQLFILFQFILPHLKYILNSAYQYDRTHKISERVLSSSISTVDTMGRRGLHMTDAVLNIGDGKVGQIMAHAAGWFVEGITGGIYEGLGEGMVIIGATRRASEAVSR